MPGAPRGDGAGRRATHRVAIDGALVRHPPEVVLCSWRRRARPAGPVPRLVLRADPDERRALLSIGRPYVVSRAGRDRIGVLLTEGTDWDEIHGLVVDSYRILAPAKLTALLDQHAPTVGPAVSSTPATRADPVGETGATAGPSDAP